MEIQEIKTANYKVFRHILYKEYDYLNFSIGKWIEQSHIMTPQRMNEHIYGVMGIEVRRHNLRYPDHYVVLEPNDGGNLKITDGKTGIVVLEVSFDTLHSSRMNFNS